MNNKKDIALLMLSGAILGGITVYTVTSASTHKVRYDLHNEKIENRVWKRWFTAAMNQMTPEQLYKMSEEATTSAAFDHIIKNL